MSQRNGTTSILEPLWMERQNVKADFEAMGLGRFPSVREIEAETLRMRGEIAGGRIPWPPAAPVGIAPGRWITPPPEFDARYIQCFGLLPSVASYFLRLEGTFRQMSQRVARMTGAPVEDSHEFARRTLHHFFLETLWTRFGKRVYVLDRQTYRALAETELPKMPARYFEPVHPTFYIRLPEGVLRVRVEGDPVPQPAEGILVNLDPLPAEDAPAEVIDRGREMSLIITGRSPRGAQDDNLIFGSLLIGPEMRLSEVRLEGLEGVTGPHGEASDAVLPRLILGLSLYLHSDHPNVDAIAPAPRKPPSALRSAHKRRKLEQRQARQSSLGSIYVRPPEGYQQEVEQKGAGMGGRTLDARQWVDAYWRWTRYGEGRKLRRYHRIAGYWRGRDRNLTPEEAPTRLLKVQRARPITEDEGR
jgi:hypothetical protein